MNMKQVADQFSQALKTLQEFSTPENFEKIANAGQLMAASLKSNGKIISCGNGGSMCDAMHFAEELTGRYRDDRPSIAAVSISDPSHISCVANDYGFEYVFSRYVESIGNKGDVLLAISTSGNSKNVILAMKAAQELGIKVFGFLGSEGGEALKYCDEAFIVPSNDTGRIQEAHITAGHALMEYVEDRLIESGYLNLNEAL